MPEPVSILLLWRGASPIANSGVGLDLSIQYQPNVRRMADAPDSKSGRARLKSSRKSFDVSSRPSRDRLPNERPYRRGRAIPRRPKRHRTIHLSSRRCRKVTRIIVVRSPI